MVDALHDLKIGKERRGIERRACLAGAAAGAVHRLALKVHGRKKIAVFQRERCGQLSVFDALAAVDHIAVDPACRELHILVPARCAAHFCGVGADNVAEQHLLEHLRRHRRTLDFRRDQHACAALGGVHFGDRGVEVKGSVRPLGKNAFALLIVARIRARLGGLALELGKICGVIALFRRDNRNVRLQIIDKLPAGANALLTGFDHTVRGKFLPVTRLDRAQTGLVRRVGEVDRRIVQCIPDFTGSLPQLRLVDVPYRLDLLFPAENAQHVLPAVLKNAAVAPVSAEPLRRLLAVEVKPQLRIAFGDFTPVAHAELRMPASAAHDLLLQCLCRLRRRHAAEVHGKHARPAQDLRRTARGEARRAKADGERADDTEHRDQRRFAALFHSLSPCRELFLFIHCFFSYLYMHGTRQNASERSAPLNRALRHRRAFVPALKMYSLFAEFSTSAKKKHYKSVTILIFCVFWDPYDQADLLIGVLPLGIGVDACALHDAQLPPHAVEEDAHVLNDVGRLSLRRRHLRLC